MKSVLYGGASFITSNAIADALMELAVAFRPFDGARLVRIPARDDGDGVDCVTMLIGPGIPLLVAASVGEESDCGTVEDLEVLRQSVTELSSARSAVPASVEDLTPVDSDFLEFY